MPSESNKRMAQKVLTASRKGIRYAREAPGGHQTREFSDIVKRNRLRIKAAKKGIVLPRRTAEELVQMQELHKGQSAFPKKPTGKLPRGPTTLLSGSKPILRKAGKLASKVGGKYLGIAEPAKAMTDITLEQQHRRRLKGLQDLTRQKFKEM